MPFLGYTYEEGIAFLQKLELIIKVEQQITVHINNSLKPYFIPTSDIESTLLTFAIQQSKYKTTVTKDSILDHLESKGFTSKFTNGLDINN